MSKETQAPEDMDMRGRMGILAGAMADAMAHKAKGEHQTEKGVQYTVDPTVVETLIEDWPDAPQRGAHLVGSLDPDRPDDSLY